YRNDLITGAYSLDGGSKWRAFASEPPGTIGAYWRGSGPITISPDARTVVWSPTGVAPHLTLDWGATWYPCVGGSVNLAVVADTVNPSKFYAYDTEAGTIVVSSDGARRFRATAGGLPAAKGRRRPGRSPPFPAARASSGSSRAARSCIPRTLAPRWRPPTGSRPRWWASAGPPAAGASRRSSSPARSRGSRASSAPTTPAPAGCSSTTTGTGSAR